MPNRCYPCTLTYPDRSCILDDPFWVPAASVPSCPVLSPPSITHAPKLSERAAEILASIPYKLSAHTQTCARCALLIAEVTTGTLHPSDALLSVCTHLSRIGELPDALDSKRVCFADLVETVRTHLAWPLSILPDALYPPALSPSFPGYRWYDVVLWFTWPPYLSPDLVACVEAPSAFTAIEYLMRYAWRWYAPYAAARALSGPALLYHVHKLSVALLTTDDLEVSA